MNLDIAKTDPMGAFADGENGEPAEPLIWKKAGLACDSVLKIDLIFGAIQVIVPLLRIISTIAKIGFSVYVLIKNVPVMIFGLIVAGWAAFHLYSYREQAKNGNAFCHTLAYQIVIGLICLINTALMGKEGVDMILFLMKHKFNIDAVIMGGGGVAIAIPCVLRLMLAVPLYQGLRLADHLGKSGSSLD